MQKLLKVSVYKVLIVIYASWMKLSYPPFRCSKSVEDDNIIYWDAGERAKYVIVEVFPFDAEFFRESASAQK